MKRYFILLYFYFLGIDANPYLKYLKDNSVFNQLAKMIESLDILNKKNIENKEYDEEEVTEIVKNLNEEYCKNLEEEIKKEFQVYTTISFDDKKVEKSYLKGIIKDSDFTSFSVSSDNHTSLNFFTNVIDQDRHVYLGDTIDKQRQFKDAPTLEKLSFLLIFTHITKGLYENIIQKGKNAIYCAGNHDIGEVFNHKSFTQRNTRSDELLLFFKKAIRLSNFVECLVINPDSFICDFKHGFGKNTFEEKYIISNDESSHIAFVNKNDDIYNANAELYEESKEYLKAGYNGIQKDATFDIRGTWGHIPDAKTDNLTETELKRLKIFENITRVDIQHIFPAKDFLKSPSYIIFFGHFHGGACNFKRDFSFKKGIFSPRKKEDNQRFSYVFMPPSFHDNEFLQTKGLNLNQIMSILPSYKFQIQNKKLKYIPLQNKELKYIPPAIIPQSSSNLKENSHSSIFEDQRKKNNLFPFPVTFGFFCGGAVAAGCISKFKNQFKGKRKYLLIAPPVIGIFGGYVYQKCISNKNE